MGCSNSRSADKRCCPLVELEFDSVGVRFDIFQGLPLSAAQGRRRAMNHIVQEWVSPDNESFSCQRSRNDRLIRRLFKYMDPSRCKCPCALFPADIYYFDEESSGNSVMLEACAAADRGCLLDIVLTADEGRMKPGITAAMKERAFRTALSVAAASVVRCLGDHHVPIPDDWYQSDRAHESGSHHEIALLNTLKAFGYNIAQHGGGMLMRWCYSVNNSAAIEWLLGNGANPNVRLEEMTRAHRIRRASHEQDNDLSFDTPLTAAAMRHAPDFDMVKVLIQFPATDINFPTTDGRTLLEHLSKCDDSAPKLAYVQRVFGMLLDRGAIVSSQAMACLDDTKLKDTEHKAYAQRPPGQRPVIYKRLNDALRQLKLAGHDIERHQPSKPSKRCYYVDHTERRCKQEECRLALRALLLARRRMMISACLRDCSGLFDPLIVLAAEYAETLC